MRLGVCTHKPHSFFATRITASRQFDPGAYAPDFMLSHASRAETARGLHFSIELTGRICTRAVKD